MSDFKVLRTDTYPDGQIQVQVQDTDTGARSSTSFHRTAFEGWGAEYGLTDPEAILDLILHAPFGFTGPDDDPRDDPALVAGWVTSTDPDAEPVAMYTARSTADALGANLARCKGRHRVVDPDGRLAAITDGLELDMDLHRRHREFVDTTRWNKIYGGLPRTRKETRRA